MEHDTKDLLLSAGQAKYALSFIWSRDLLVKKKKTRIRTKFSMLSL